MPKHGKRYRQASDLIDKKKFFSVKEAVEILCNFPKTKYDETIELTFNLNADPKHADQLVRGTVVLPHGTGKSVRVLVFAQGDKEKDAQTAGADYVGYKDLAEKIKGGWMDFDVVIASPDTMSEVGKLGKILGPKGLMPSPKAGTVTPKVAEAIKEVKAGRIEFRIDKGGNLHLITGKRSFPKENLMENVKAGINAVIKARPSAVKGQYVNSATLSTSMSPGISLDVGSIVTSY